MEVLAPILLGLISLVPIGAVVAVAVHAHNAQQQRQQQWGKIAARLGLQYQGDRVVGAIDGQNVQMRTESRSAGKSQQTFTVWESFIQPPFDLGLSVREKNLLSGVAILFGQQDVHLGNPSFDEQFIVQGDDPERLQAAITPEVQAGLMRIVQAGYYASISDVAVHVETTGAEDHPGRITALLQNVAAIGRALERARSGISVAAPLVPHRERWAQFATLMGLRGLDCPLCMWGEIDGLFVQAYAIRVEGGAYHLEVRVRFPKPLGLGLVLRARQGFDNLSALFAGNDIETGDKAFDKAFVIRTTREDLVPQLFDDGTRRRILEIHDKHPVHLVDGGVMLRSQNLYDPTQVPRLIAQAKAILEDIYAGAQRGGAVGPTRPYR